jgi:hypothetical protein
VNCHVEKQRRERTTIRTSGSAVRQVAWQLDMTSTCHRWWWWCDSCKYSIAGSMRQHPRFRCKHQAGKRCSTRPVLVRVMSATDRQLDQQPSSFCPLPLPPTESNRPRSHNLGTLPAPASFKVLHRISRSHHAQHAAFSNICVSVSRPGRPPLSPILIAGGSPPRLDGPI